MIEKASNYTMNALNKSSELWHSSSGRKVRPHIGAFLYKNSSDHGAGLRKVPKLRFSKMLTEISRPIIKI